MSPTKNKASRIKLGCSRLPGVSLADAASGADGADDAAAKWRQVAQAGEFRGYGGGYRPFALTRAIFEQCVRNLHAHPGFRAGPNGEGQEPLIQWDFDHISETQSPDPAVGSPAIGWSLDLKIVDGASGPQLWALTKYLEPASGYIREGKYRGASVVLDFNHIDPVTGENVGAYVHSIALTNSPFIQGMQPIAASYYCQAESPQEALDAMRETLGLTAIDGVEQVVVALGKLRGWIQTGTAPLGVDIEGIIACFRRILGVPALATGEQVLDNADQIVNRLLSATGPIGTGHTTDKGTSTMDIKLFASKLDTRETEEAVLAAVVELTEMRAGFVKALGLSSRDGHRVMLAEVEAAVATGADARSKLTALLTALGVEDVNQAVERLATLMSQADALKQVMPELEALRVQEAVSQEAAAMAAVDQAMASYGIPGEARDALVLLHHSDKDRFAAKFPVKSAKPGVQGADRKALLSVVAPVVPLRGGAPAVSDGSTVNLSVYEGRNPTERAMKYLQLHMEGWSKLTPEEQFKAAVTLKRQPNVVTSVG